MSDEHDDERPDEESPDGSAEESPGESAEESGDESAGGGGSDDDEEFGDELSSRAAPSGPAVLDMADLDALDDSDLSIEVEGMEQSEADPEVAIDLSEFDAELEDPEALDVEFEAARTQADELRREKAEVEEELATVRDQLRRTAADLENYRKRIERDRREEKKHAASSLVLKLLAVTDNFQRALEQGDSAAADNEVVAGFVEGVRLIETQFFDILRAAGLEPVDADGVFDPAVHEALMQEPSADAPHLSILEVYERGYLFGGRLLRPARVKVAHNPDRVAPPVEEEASSTSSEEGAEVDEAGSGQARDETGEEAAEDSAADEPTQDSDDIAEGSEEPKQGSDEPQQDLE